MGVRHPARVVLMTASTRRIVLHLVILLGALSCMLLLYGATAPIEISQPVSDGRTINLQSGVTVGQSFVAYFPGLNRISIQVDRLPEGTLDTLTFGLNTGLPGEETTILRTSDVRFQHDQGWIHILFPPQPFDPFRRYVFYLSSFSSEPIVLNAHSQNMYPQGTLINAFGDLVFEAGFRPSALRLPGIMLSRLTYGKPGLAGAGWVYVFLLIGMSASLMMLVETTIQSENRD
jgi:hypothetical protein